MKILVLGAKGMAGHVIYRRLRKEGVTLVGTSRNGDFYKDPNVVPFDAIKDSWEIFFSEFRDLNFDLVINCIGVLVQQSSLYPDIAMTVNANLPKFLEKFFANTSTRIIHISTDCVFSGSRGDYKVWEVPDAVDAYGVSKSKGELNNAKDLTLRTSIIGLELSDKPNSAENSGLLQWFLSRPKHSEIQGFSNCFWSGVSTLELADAVEWYIQNPYTGLHQVSRRSKISKHKLLQIANDVFERELTIYQDPSKVVDKSLVPSPLSYKVESSFQDMMLRISSES